MTFNERTGILLIADISGYTEYLSHTELAHARDIVSASRGDHLRSSAFALVKRKGMPPSSSPTTRLLWERAARPRHTPAAPLPL